MDTIFALSSGALPAAIGIVRLSGPKAGDALQALVGRLPQPRTAVLVRVRDPESGAAIDQALALWFPAPSSETGENMAELQLHGGRAVVAAVFAALGRMDGIRLAEPGEFTRRALANGHMDLPAVEALADLIAAETEQQRGQAIGQMMGGLSRRAEAWRRQIISAQARIEAAIDFSDEGDVSEDVAAASLKEVAGLRAELDAVLAEAQRGERVRDGIVVAIAGPPNAGKSSLMNAIAQRDVAIVSPIAGTTRDVIEVHLDLQGFPVTIIDTAGIHDSSEPIEQEGIRRSRLRAESADLVLWVDDLSGQPVLPEAFGVDVWRIGSKSDLVDSSAKQRSDWLTSTRSGDGVGELVSAIGAYVAERYGRGESRIITRERHRLAIQDSRDALLRAEAATLGDEVVAEELRLAGRGLERLLGRIDVEHVLDAVFRDFCIGK
jgi:tRNA modification GTPase